MVPIFILLSSLFFFFFKSNVFDAGKWKITDHHRVIKKIIEQIPQEASLSADVKIAVHAAERHELYAFNDHAYDADYVLYDFYARKVTLVSRTTFHLPVFWADNDSIRRVLANEEYGIVEYEDGICLLKKNANYRDGLKKLAYSDGSDIKNTLSVEIAPGLECKGFNTFEQLRYYVELEKFGPIRWQRGIHFTCFWEETQNQATDINFVFKVENEETGDNFLIEHQPVFGVFPATNWETGRKIRDEIYSDIPGEMNTGIYKISVSIKSESEDNKFTYLFDVNIE